MGGMTTVDAEGDAATEADGDAATEADGDAATEADGDAATEADGDTDGAALGDGSPPTPRWLGWSRYRNAPPTKSTPMMAATARRVGVNIVGNLHGTRRSRSWDVVWIWRSAASTTRSGASVGPTSSHDRAARSRERSSVMRGVLPGSWAGHPRRGRRGAAGGVVQARSGRPGRDAEHLGDLDQGQPEVVVQDEHRSLVDREVAERPFQFIAIGDRDARIRRRSAVCGHGADGGRPRTRPLRLVVAGVNEDAMDPRLEALGFPQVRQLAPGEDEGVL